ncbi:M20 family metallopeptidase [Tropicimonas sediminicola]|uniref:Succinyl-diaminopimelate desuccinylase n=1 Tax=Tropicimonas sediminicola TaxID=1031541 RepID=A0A239J7J0_9RHOB|nr:M20 family metallopeptidase [Tropicimonas sediminicola]SNT01861.1 succinyl-diaminopimelate desuccinylase [Tropicimonas sediminicola]
MIEALRALIGSPTPMPPGDGYAAFADLVADLFRPLGGTAERVIVPRDLWDGPNLSGERINLILRPEMPGATDALPEAMIYFHTDTAPVGDGWTVAPCSLTQQGDRLYGRGTADMKGTIVAVRDALLRLATADTPLAFRPVLAFCTDEEGGRYPGIRHLAETRPLPEVLLNLNGSAEPRIWAGCLGSIDMTLTVTGRASHSGEPDRGINAAEALLPALVALNALKTTVETRTTALPPPPWSDGPLRARLNVTAIHAGEKGSALPGLAQATINRRYLAEENEDVVLDELRAAVTNALEGTPALDWTMQVTGHLPPVSDPDGPATRRWILARARAFGLPEDAFLRYGSGTSSDFGWVQKAGLKHMLLGGLSRPDRNVHGPDEFTTVEDLRSLSDAIFLFLAEGCAPQGAEQTGNAPTEGSPQ